MNSRLKKIICSTVMMIFCINTVVYAETKINVLETYTGEDNVRLYVEGVEGDVSEVAYQIGTSPCENTISKRITELDVPIQTLIMVDNSLSITSKNREIIQELLTDIVANRADGEKFRLATFSEEIAYLTDYSSDYAALKQVIQGIQYQDQETYLTDVLYDVLTEMNDENSEVFKRIIIISDGVDNKTIGYTKDELYDLLKTKPYPVYSFGCIYKNNNEQLENMFALSRITNADSFIVDELQEPISALEALAQDYQTIQFLVSVPTELSDGSTKSSKLTFSIGEETYSAATDITLPFKISEPIEEEAVVELVEPVQEQEPEPVEPIEEPKINKILKMTVLSGIILLVLGMVVTTLVYIRRRKQKENVFEELSFDFQDSEKTEMPYDESEHTLMLNEHGESTVLLENGMGSRNIILTDVSNPIRTFQTSIATSVVIGRIPGAGKIVIDYDKSISGNHCEMCLRDNRFYVKDLGSSNGTFLNDSRVIAETEVYSGSILKLGRLVMRIEMR